MQYRFFSIIIPAHNEELIIEQTALCLENLEYPKNRYEVILVENGSTDATYERALQYASDTFKIFSSQEKGVSRARNFGKTKCSPELDWCIFMDADVFLAKSFLLELNEYIEKHMNVGYGTTTVLFDSDSYSAKFWSTFNNFFYRLFGVLFTIHIIRKDLLMKVSYDENLTSGEDTVYGRDLAKLGKYFFMRTRSVVTSPRRFEKRGYLKMFFVNLYRGILCVVLPKSILEKLDWEVIR